MADATTSIFGITKPEVGASADTWGGKQNDNRDLYDKLLGAITTGGSSNAYTLTTGQSYSALVANMRFCVKWNHTNSGAATLNVDGIGAVAITKNGTTALASGDATSGLYAIVAYDGTQWQIVGVLSGVYQLLDADLTALGALGYTSGSYLIKKTAANTYSLITVTSFAESILDDANESTFKATVNLEIGTDVQAYDANLTTWAGKTAPSGTVVGTTDTQTLTNKTLTSPTINSPSFGGSAANLVSGSQVNGSTILTGAAGQIIGSGSLTPHSFGDELALRNESTSGGLSILTGASSIGYIFFGDSGSNTRSRFGYDHSSDQMFFGVAGDADNLVIDLTKAEFDVCDLRIEPNPASIATNSAGFLGVPNNAANTSSFTLALSAAGKHHSISMSSASQTVTIPPNSSVAFPIGTAIVLRGASGGNTFTIIEGSGVSLLRGDGVSGSGTRTMTTGAERIVTLFKIDTNTWIITGAFT